MIRLLVLLAALVAPASAFAQELRFGYPATPAGSIGIAVNQCAATTVAVRADAPYRSLDDLKGKRIGSEIGSVTHSTLVNRVLSGSDRTPGDFKIVNVRFRDMISALLANSLEAVTAVEPFLSAAEHANSVRVLTDFCPHGKVYMLLVANEQVRASGEPVRNFLHAIAEIHDVFKS